MLWPLLLNISGFLFVLAALVCLRLANQILINDARRPWVKAMVSEKTNKAVQFKNKATSADKV
jgi:hypothetical protein